MTRSRRTLVAVVGAAAIAAGCSSSSASSGTSKTTKAPEEIVVSDAKVTAGLGAMKTLFTDAADALDGQASASEFPDKIEHEWSQIEGTVKKNDPDAYLRVEDARSAVDNAIKDKKAAAASTAAQDFSTAADKYLAQYP